MTRAKSLKTLDIIAYRTHNPCLTQQQIGDFFGVTYQIVSYILNMANVKATRYTYINTTCPICGGLKSYGASKCMKCVKLDAHVPIKCSQCRHIFYKPKWFLIRARNKKRQQLFFCNNYCKGKWLGKHYGKGRTKLMFPLTYVLKYTILCL